MKSIHLFLALTGLLFFVSCDDDSPAISPEIQQNELLKQHTFFADMEVNGEPVRFEVNGTENTFVNDGSLYRLGTSSGWSCQNKQVVSGTNNISIQEYDRSSQNTHFSLNIKRKISKTDLDRNNPYDYLLQVLQPSNGFAYPSDRDGFYSYVENNQVVIGEDGTSEVYIDFKYANPNWTNTTYKSTNPDDVAQPASASFRITNIIDLGEEIGNEYQQFRYIIEGEFSCTLSASGTFGNDLSITNGTFRLPYSQKYTDNLFRICE